MKKITSDWLKSAESDLAIIERISKEENLTHQVAFHAQQAVEKSLKAIIEEFELGFIKTHSLISLSGIVQEKLNLDTHPETLILLDQLYIDARYPGEFGLLPDGKPSVEKATEFTEFAIRIFNLVNEIVR
jgi:HEPN domain-containing protein